MLVGLQTPEGIATLEKLNLADASVDLPTIDPGILNPTLPIDPAFVRKGDVAFSFPSVSINGAASDRSDTADAVMNYSALGDTNIPAGNNRYYQFVSCILIGGGVSPINVSIILTQTGGWSFRYASLDIPNPGRGYFYGVNVPFSFSMRLRTNTNGGAGDTATGAILGVSQKPGVAFPLLPPGQNHTST